MKKVLGIILLSVACSKLAISEPSFDCNKDLTPVEQAICRNSWLSSLDAYYSLIHEALLIEVVDRNAFVLDQRGWLKERDKCETIACVSQAYLKRLDTQFSKYGRVLHGNWLNPNAIIKKLKEEATVTNTRLAEKKGLIDLTGSRYSVTAARTIGIPIRLGARSGSRSKGEEKKVAVPTDEQPVGIQHNLAEIGEEEDILNPNMFPDTGYPVVKPEPASLHKVDSDMYIFEYNFLLKLGIIEEMHSARVILNKNMTVKSVEHNAENREEEYIKREELEIENYVSSSSHPTLKEINEVIHDIYKKRLQAADHTNAAKNIPV